MEYKKIIEGRFVSRPNRFIAYVDIEADACADSICDAQEYITEKVHVKNTGRCQELLTPGARVYLEENDNPGRSTRYDLVAVLKGERMINMDSQAPNRAVAEWLKKKILFPDLTAVKPEYKYGNSRFDFYVETSKDKILIEVKGVTLETDNVVYFPDAPSERAVKHVKELMKAMKEGYQAYIILVIQMKDVKHFQPNEETHPAFAEALIKARDSGVKVIAYDCLVTPESMVIKDNVPVSLTVLDRIVPLLLEWYDKGKRILPWRESPTPYHVWLSEIMLQQTRVEAVKPYYERFLKVLPDIESLAGADEELLLKLWEGLGYYNRVRNLQKAARQIMEKYQGEIPADYEQLMKLSGIGCYTAGAISSIAYNRRVPAVDGNVLRVIFRLRGDDSDVSRPDVKNRLVRELAAVIPEERPGDFNQALMELGAMTCIPNGHPKCHACPLEELCSAHSTGRETDYPVKAPKKARVIEYKTILVLRDENKVALQKRPDKGLLAGMYEFPSLEGHLSENEVLKALKDKGLTAIHWKQLPPGKHIFTHREWHMTGYVIRVDELEMREEQAGELVFVEIAEAQEKYPIPSAYAAYTEYLNMK